MALRRCAISVGVRHPSRKNRCTRTFCAPTASPPRRMTATVARVESLPPALTVPQQNGGHFLPRREKLETSDEVIEATADGWPALICAGGIHYLAGWMDDTASASILTALCHKAGIETDPLPEGLWRSDAEISRGPPATPPDNSTKIAILCAQISHRGPGV